MHDAPDQSAPTVFVVDDDEALRTSFAWLLASVGFAVETCESAEAFLAACTPQRPGCAIVDLALPGLDGVALQAALTARGILLPVIIVTGHAGVASVVAAFRHGAFDYLEKPCSEQVLLDRVNAAVAQDAAARAVRRAAAVRAARLARLSRREREVLALVCGGHTSREIAVLLALSPRTIEAHRSRCMQKLAADSLADLVRRGCPPA